MKLKRSQPADVSAVYPHFTLSYTSSTVQLDISLCLTLIHSLSSLYLGLSTHYHHFILCIHSLASLFAELFGDSRCTEVGSRLCELALGGQSDGNFPGKSTSQDLIFIEKLMSTLPTKYYLCPMVPYKKCIKKSAVIDLTVFRTPKVKIVNNNLTLLALNNCLEQDELKTLEGCSSYWHSKSPGLDVK